MTEAERQPRPNGATEATPDQAELVARGVCRLLREMRYRALTEFKLRNRRRADVIGLGRDGEIAIVEIKTSLADFRADGKWHEYVPYCDSFYFAVPEGFPRERLPGDCGLIVADAYHGAILRTAPHHALNPARRRALVLRFARTAGDRLQRLTDPTI